MASNLDQIPLWGDNWIIIMSLEVWNEEWIGTRKCETFRIKHIDGVLGKLDSANDTMMSQRLTKQELCLNSYKSRTAHASVLPFLHFFSTRHAFILAFIAYCHPFFQHSLAFTGIHHPCIILSQRLYVHFLSIPSCLHKYCFFLHLFLFFYSCPYVEQLQSSHPLILEKSHSTGLVGVCLHKCLLQSNKDAREWCKDEMWWWMLNVV